MRERASSWDHLLGEIDEAVDGGLEEGMYLIQWGVCLTDLIDIVEACGWAFQESITLLRIKR